MTGVSELDAASQAVGPDEEVAEDEDEDEEMGKDNDEVDDEEDEGDAVAPEAEAEAEEEAEEEEEEEAQGAAFDREPAAEPVKSSCAITPSFFHNFQHQNPSQLPAPETPPGDVPAAYTAP